MADEETPEAESSILTIDINEEMSKSFVDYAMSVIVSRALPDVRDGLKPVQRRIIYAMDDMGVRPGGPHRKSATVVGEVIGKYHPHSNDAIYDALVRMGQDFSLRYQLIDPQGNFGTPDDLPAAMRYCLVGESRLRTADGSIRIDSIADLEPNSEVDIDLKVLDRRGEQVRATKFFHSGTHEVLRLTTREGFSLTGTHNHPVLALTSISGVPLLQWRLLDELRPGDQVAIGRNQPVEVPIRSDRSAAAAFLAGAFVAEGWVSEGRAGFNNTDANYFVAVRDAYELVVGGKHYENSRTLPSGKTLFELDVQQMSAIQVSPLSEMIGHRSADKRIPEFVWAGTMSDKQAFIQAAFEGDGSVSRLARNSIQIWYSTRSERLASDLQKLLLEFAVVARRSRYDNGEIKLTIGNRREVEAFASMAGFFGEKQAKLERLLAQTPARGRALSKDRIPFLSDFVRKNAGRGGLAWLKKYNIDRIDRWDRYGDEILEHIADPETRSVTEEIVRQGYFYATVSSVESAGTAPVYSIRVDSDDHSFLADGFVNHNTECRMDEIATVLLDGIDEQTVDFIDTYDGSGLEPSVLPSRFPNLLVNGSQGIAVGMATNMPPYNLGEIVEACLFGLANPDAGPEDYLSIVKGPDFPTGGYLVGTSGSKDALVTGRGSVKVRAVADVEEIRKGRTAIVVTELPYQVSQDRVLAKIAELVNDKRLTGISDLRNESSSRTGMRLVIELKRDAIPQVVLNQLYKMTQLQDSFGVNAVALVDGVPRTLNIAQLVGYYLDHQMEVIERRTKFRLEKAEDRAHVLEGLIIAVDNIDEVIKIIRASADTDAARGALMERFELSEVQARAILEMPLRRLTSLETNKLREEFEQLQTLIAELKGILGDPARRREIISDELGDVLTKHGDKRRSRIIPDEGDLSLEDLIADDELVVTVSANGYLKSVPANTYRAQGRGGRGVIGAEVREDDVLTQVLHTTAHAYLMFFTNTGKVHRIKAHEIPRQARTAKGVMAQSVLPLEPNERIEAIVDTRDYETARYLVMVTKKGQVKKTEFKEYDSRNSTLVAINLAEGDEVVAVRTTSGENELLLFTKAGQGIRFAESELRPMGRATQGVRGVRLREDDEVVSAAANVDGDEVLILTSGGYGKRTKMDQFPLQKRGGMGVKSIKLTKVRGHLVGARAVGEETEIFIISSTGIVIRTPAKRISRQKRDATGVKVMDVAKGTFIAAFTPVPAEEED